MLKTVLTSLDGVDDATKALYKETTVGEKTLFVLQIEGIDAHPNVANLKSAHEAQKDQNRTLRAEKALLEKRVEGLPEDFDGDAYEDLKERAEKGGGGKPDPAEVERIVQERIQRGLKKVEKERDDAVTDRDRIKEKLHSRERDLALNESLAAAGVTDPVYLKAARSMLRDQLEVIEDDDGSLSILAQDPDLGTRLPAGDFIKNWAETEEGKSFVGARNNGGGGAEGGKPSTDAKVNPWKADSLNLTEQARIEREDPQQAARLKAAAGKK